MRCYYSDYLLSFLLRSVSVLVSNSLVMDMLLVLGFWSCSHHNLLVVTVFKERYYFCLGRSSNGIRLSSYCFFSNVLSVHVLYMYRLFSCPPCSYRMLAELSEISFEWDGEGFCNFLWHYCYFMRVYSLVRLTCLITYISILLWYHFVSYANDVVVHNTEIINRRRHLASATNDRIPAGSVKTRAWTYGNVSPKATNDRKHEDIYCGAESEQEYRQNTTYHLLLRFLSSGFFRRSSADKIGDRYTTRDWVSHRMFLREKTIYVIQ